MLIDESKRADIENLGECPRALGDGQTLGDFSLTVVLYSTDLQTISQEMGVFTGLFTNADGALCTEIYNQLNALLATVPGTTTRISARCTCSIPTMPTFRFSS